MNDARILSFPEFLADIRGVVTSPARRFSLIRERGARWGSLLLLIAPAYYGFAYLGGIYFKSDPVPGYSFILPAAGAAAMSLLEVYFIHVVARLFEGKWRLRAATGRFRDLLAVFGYTRVPVILALLVALGVFFLMPEQIGFFYQHFRIVGISVLIALGFAFIIWNLILMVLALRPVYPMHDFKIVISVLLGPMLMTFPTLALTLLAAPARVDVVYLRPIVNEMIQPFLTAEPGSPEYGHTKISIHIDLVAYRLKPPQRFELVAFPSSLERSDGKGRQGGHQVINVRTGITFQKPEQSVGRIVGMPGDRVELSEGKLLINGRTWAEPYLVPEYRSNDTVPSVTLGPSEYFILPEDRRLVDSHREDLAVGRERISGRLIVRKWPLGWLFYRPTAFLSGAVSEDTRVP